MESSKKTAAKIGDSMKKARTDFEPQYEELSRFFLPNRGLFSGDPTSEHKSKRGKPQGQDILDGTPIRARRILQSGFQSGISSPARPWFRVQTVDPDRREREAVKRYLGRAEQEMRMLALRSGLYNMLHIGYGDLGVFGTEAAIVEDYKASDLRGLQLVPGTYWVGMSEGWGIDTLFREYGLTVSQIVRKFVYKGNSKNEPDWGAVPKRIKKLWDDGQTEEVEPVCQLIMPRLDRDERIMTPDHKPIASLHWVKNDDRPVGEDRYAIEGGYDENPISASRWDANGFETYGYSPGMDAIFDTRELMAKRRDYAELLHRINRPPMNIHASLRGGAFSLLPGARNYMDDISKGAAPAFQVTPQFAPLNQDIEMTKDGIWSAMYADLFMMISQLDRRQITATEIDERREEKLISLGPVLERQHFEKLRPLVERLFRRVQRSGVLGPPPEELKGVDLEIDFVSMLAQAQKAIATGSIERLAGYVGNLAGAMPDVLDKLDGDQSVDVYADMLGVPPGVVRSDEAVEKLREQRRAAQEQAAAMEQMVQGTKAAQQGAQAAQVLSQADSPRGAAPIDLLNKIGLGA